MSEDKTKLELKKLQLEINELDRPIWGRPAFLGAFVPLMLAFVGLASTVFTGFFDERMAALRDQRKELEKVIESQLGKIEQRNIEIEDKNAEIESKEEELGSLEDSIIDYTDQVKISVEEREVGRLLHGIRSLY